MGIDINLVRQEIEKVLQDANVPPTIDVSYALVYVGLQLLQFNKIDNEKIKEFVDLML